MFCGSGGSSSIGLLTRQVQSYLVGWGIIKRTRLWREENFKVKTEHSWKCCGAKHMPKTKCQEHHMFRALSDVGSSCFVAGAMDCVPCQKWTKPGGLVAVARWHASWENVNGGTFTRDVRTVRRSGRWFPGFQRGCTSERPIFRFAKVILRGRCSTFTFSWQARYFRQMGHKNRKTHGHEAVSSALSVPVLKEVSQNCFVFDVANSKIEKASQNFFVLGLRTSLFEEVLQKCFLLDLSTSAFEAGRA